MFEILFFAILSGYLFFRLWSVLGTRTGFEKQENPNEEKSMITVKDNVVALPSADVARIEESPRDVFETFWEQIRQIQEKEKDFQIEDFLDNARHAFAYITQAFVEGDKSTLNILLTETTFKQFCDVIDRREMQGHRIANEIVGRIDAILKAVTVAHKQAHITLTFTSYQRFVTYDEAGEILDNPEKITTKMVNDWTFTRTLGSDDPTWRLSHTRVGD